MRNLHKKTYIVFDLETTGLSPAYGDEIIEIGALKCKKNKICQEFHGFVVPKKEIPWGAYNVHGLSKGYLIKHGFEDIVIIPQFIKFIQDFPLIGHNIRYFDIPFVNSHLEKLKLPLLTNQIYDTIEIARKVVKLDSYRLQSLANHFNIDYSKAHRAKDDARITHEVLLRLLGLNDI